jgi:hypothetical protein
MKNINADKIIWTGNTLDEMRRLLGGDIEIEFPEMMDRTGLDYPWPITVKSVEAVSDPAGGVWATIILGFDEISGATDYEVRTSIQAGSSTPLKIFSLWNNTPGGAGYALLGDNSVRLTPAAYGQGTCIRYPDVLSGWSKLEISFDITQSYLEADGYAIALEDALIYSPTYIGDGGQRIWFNQQGGGISGYNGMDNSQGRYSIFFESIYPYTGNSGPTIQSNSTYAGGMSTVYTTLARGAWAMTGTHNLKITWTRTAYETANMVVVHDNNETLSMSVFAPQNARLSITAATGVAWNDHSVSNFSGTVTRS